LPRNGAGSYQLPEAAFLPNTPISSSAVNSDLSDIGTALTGSIAADGQTTITGALKGSSGTASAPSYSFSTDLNTGMYRVSADVLGFAAGGTKIVEVSATGVTIAGTLTPTGNFVAPDGTVLLPSYTFANDLDSGLYRIGANNIGVSVNAAKVLDISAAGLDVVGAVTQNGSPLSQAAYAAGMINGTIVESHTGNAVTFALKTLAGSDPSITDPVVFSFRDVTAATGGYVLLSATAAMSLTISSGSTLGFSSGVAGKLWVVAFNDGGTVRLGAINCRSGTNIYPLGQFPIASSTAEGGAGAADSAQVFYTGTAVSSKAYIPLAYASYETGIATAGSWNASPTRLMLYGLNVPMPGQTIQVQQNATGALATGSTATPSADTIPQNNEGDEYLSQAITPTSAANILRVEMIGRLTSASGVIVTGAVFRDSGADAIAAAQFFTPGSQSNSHIITFSVLAGATSSTTFKYRAGGTSGTVTFNGTASARLLGGVNNSYMTVTEIVA
jgi:hypothetical protein